MAGTRTWGLTYSLDNAHLGLIRSTTTLGIRPMPIAELGVAILRPWDIDINIGGGIFVQLLIHRGIEAGDMFLEEWADGLADEVGGHLDESGLIHGLRSSPFTGIL